MLEEIREKWSEILDYLRREYDVTDISFKTWLLPLKVAAVEEGVITIVAPEDNTGLQYMLQYIRKKYYTPLKVTIEEITGEPYEIEFVLPSQTKNTEPKVEIAPQSDVYEKAGLNPKYTFSSFVVGNNSSLAHAAALAVAESPAEVYNPLYIYGGVGLGKTHLIQAIAHFVLDNNPQAKVLYVSCETFTNEIIEAIRTGGPLANVQFREKYRNVDVLLIDDIQFIAGKETVQTEFFHTFNALHENNKQIIITSDKPPKDINNLEERLRSRFLWGLSVDIQSPDYETRVAILQKKVQIEGYPHIPGDVIDFIAKNVSSNIRELEGALTKVVAYSRLTGSEITLDFVTGTLQDLFEESPQQITPDMIIKIVAEHFGVSISDITSKKKNAEIVYPRQLIMYLCRTLTDVALSLIGKKLGNRDHTTIIYGYEKIQREIDTDDSVKNDVEILKKKIIPAQYTKN